MSLTIAPERVQQLLLQQLKSEIDKLCNAHIEKAVAQFETDLRDKMGHIALRLLSQYDVYRDGTNLMIRVIQEPRK